jgi:predicted GNAT family N-acyltransferase
MTNTHKNRINYTVKIVSWASAEPQIKPIREIVFIQEQHVPVELEWDGLDAESTQILSLLDDDMPVGTARLLQNGHIGRMAEWQY